MSITAEKPAISGKYLCHDRLPSHAATNSPELKIHSSARATAASARATPDQKPFPRDHTQRPSRDSATASGSGRSEEHTSELQSHLNLVCRLLLQKKTKTTLSHAPLLHRTRT